jgi:hypothetical protein
MAYQKGSRVTDKLAEIDVAIQETNMLLQAHIKKLPSTAPNNSRIFSTASKPYRVSFRMLKV